VNRERAERSLVGGHLLATDLADYLVEQGLPFRQAHEVVGKVVAHCVARGSEIGDLTLDEFRSFSDRFGDDITAYATVAASLARKAQPGGTAPARVAERLAHWEKVLGCEV